MGSVSTKQTPLPTSYVAESRCIPTILYILLWGQNLVFEPQIRPPDSPEKKDFWGPKWPPIASLNLPPRNARIATCQRFERCLPFAFARAGAQRSSAARCTLVAPRSQRSCWTAGGGLPARAVDGRRICLVAACWSTCELHRVVGTAPLLLAMRLELQLRASVAFTQLVRDSTA